MSLRSVTLANAANFTKGQTFTVKEISKLLKNLIENRTGKQ